MKSILKIITIALTAVLFRPVNADTVYTLDGARLIGKVKKITREQIEIDTEFAGTIYVKQEFVETLTTDEDLTSKLVDGTTVTGRVNINSGGLMEVKNETLDLQTSIDKLVATWDSAQTPPVEAGYKMKKQWKYSVAADITGKQGNSEEMGIAVQGSAKLVDDTDTLQFDVSVDRAEKSGTDTSNEMIFGASYITYVYEPWGWYVHSDIEKDEFESIDLRTNLTGGLSYRMINQPEHKLAFNTGIGYRYEAFDDGTKESSPTLDFGLQHEWQIQPWVTMTNSVTFAPALTDFGDYLLKHDSGFNFPIAPGKWNLRLGMENDFKSLPAVGNEKLDTTYYTRLLMNF